MTPRRSFGVAPRFFLVLAVTIPSLVAVAVVGVQGLVRVGGAVNFLYQNTVVTAEAANAVSGGIDAAHEAALGMLATDDPATRQRLYTELIQTTVPGVDSGLVDLRRNLDPAERSEIADFDAMKADWSRFVGMIPTGELSQSDPHLRAVAAAKVSDDLGAINDLSRDITTQEATQAKASYRLARHRQWRSLQLIAVALLTALALGIGVVTWLIRSVLPRTLAYSRFAARVAEGDDTPMEEPVGSDEIADLGRVLQTMAARGRSRRAYEQSQLEFAEAMQLTDTDSAAHLLLKHHLERCIEGSEVTVLNRNNSADRLDAVTPTAPGEPLAVGLSGAKPRSCLAVRQARPHTEARNDLPLVACDVCSGCAERSVCTPLLVGGQVIGAVLATHARTLTGEESSRIHDSVRQAAPVLANLRNLALAEFRAATDALTGLPNKRAVTDNLKRMVAQAHRTSSSLALLMLDLDHFKQINDRCGHARGDEVLAAVGAALAASTRDSDFAGRYGGEEFAVMLPGVSVEGAVTAAEKIQTALREISVVGLDRFITASIGIAMVPEHGGAPDPLERAADRALYEAKRNGRDRIEVAPSPDAGHSEATLAAV